MTKPLLILLIIACYGCGGEKEFSYKIYDLKEFVAADLEYKTENEAILGTKEMKFKVENNKIKTFVYMTSGNGIDYEPLIEFKDEKLMLSVKRTYKEESYEEEKVVYAFSYTIDLDNRKNIKAVYFRHPNTEKEN